LLLFVVLAACLSVVARPFSPAPAAAQADDQATYARLLAEYQATPTLSTGCSLAEVERRLGRLDAAVARLDALLPGAEGDGGDDAVRATYSACLFNRARLYEEQGDLGRAYAFLGRALDTPNPLRRRAVEQRLVQVAGRFAQATGCASLISPLSAQGLLRFGDNAALRRCAQSVQRAQPFCSRIAAADMPGPDDYSRYQTRRLDPETVAIVDQGFLLVITRRGARASGIECRLPNSEEQVAHARWLTVGRQRLLLLHTDTSVSYSCDCDEGGAGGGDGDEVEDCRCSDDSSSLYVLSARGELVLALVDAFEDGSMAAWGPDAPELRESTHQAVTAQGSVVVMGERRLRLVRGALVPAP
jgi:hypothetical protein